MRIGKVSIGRNHVSEMLVSASCSEGDVGLRVCAGIRPVADVEVAAAKDGSCGCDEILLKRSVKKQRLED